MSDEELLRRLAKVAREARPAAQWDDVLEGGRDADDVVAELEAAGDDIDELNALADASAPLDDAEREAWTKRIADKIRDGSDVAEEDDPLLDPEPSPQDEAEPEKVVELSERRSSMAGAVVAVLVAVAAAVVIWMQRPERVVEPEAGAALPGFSLVVRNDTIGEIRGKQPEAADRRPRYRVDSRIHWMLNPSAPTPRAVEVAIVASNDEGATCLARPKVARSSAQGVQELRGTVADVLGIGPGTWTIAITVAPEGTVPDPGTVDCTAADTVPCLCGDPRSATSGPEHRAVEGASIPGFAIVVVPDAP